MKPPVKIEGKIKGYSVVSPEDRAREEVVKAAAAPIIVAAKPFERPDVVVGKTYKIRPGDGAAMYITINDLVLDTGGRRPIEIFINTKNVEHLQWVVALTRMISAVFRKPGDFLFIIDELKQVFDPKGGYFIGGPNSYVNSVVAHIGRVLEQHCADLMPAAELTPANRALIEEKVAAAKARGDSNLRDCPSCEAQKSMIRLDGCDTCTVCGHSKCG